MSKIQDERDQARKLVMDARGFNPSEVERNLIQANELMLDQLAYLWSEIVFLENKIENLQARLDYHNLS